MKTLKQLSDEHRTVLTASSHHCGTNSIENDIPSSDSLRERLAKIETALRRPVRVAHVMNIRWALDNHWYNRIELLRDYGFSNFGISTHDGSPYKYRVREHDLAYQYLPVRNMNRQVDPLADVRAVAEFMRLFRTHRFDIVNTYGPKPGIVARIAARLAGAPFVVHTSFGLLFSEKTSVVRKSAVLAVEFVCSQFSDWVLSVNHDDILYLKRMTPFRRHNTVTYLGNATDLDRFAYNAIDHHKVRSLRSKWGVRESETVITMVGRLVREKGCLELLEAAKILKGRKRNCVFVLIGPLDTAKKDVVDHSIFEPFVKPVGFVSDMPSALAASDIVVLPSHREGFPRVLVEACAMGRPIVTTDTRGCREAVEHGRNGFLVPLDDPVSLADAIDRFLLDEELRRNAGVHSLKKASREFNNKMLIRRLVSVYMDLLETKIGL